MTQEAFFSEPDTIERAELVDAGDALSIEGQRAMLAAEVVAMTQILRRDGYEQRGSMGQVRPHWALSQRRAALDALRKLDALAGVESDDPLEEFEADEAARQ